MKWTDLYAVCHIINLRSTNTHALVSCAAGSGSISGQTRSSDAARETTGAGDP